jgi:hypothetical protein
MVPLRKVIFAAFALASGVMGQTTSRTFHLTTVTSQAGLNEIATIIRTLGGGVPTSDAADITVSGTDDELAFAAWLVQHLDLQNPPLAPAQYTVTGSEPDSVRIFYLAHTPAQAPLNEFVTNLRVNADIQRIFTYSPLRAVAIRTTAAKAQLAEWMVHQMDVSPDSHASGGRFDLATPGRPSEVVEVAYLTHPLAGPGLNEIVTTLRTVADMQKIFTHSSAPQGMAFRNDAAHVQFADWLFHQLDALPDARARAQKHEYVIADSPDPIARLYYLNTSGRQAGNEIATAIRSETQVRRIFFCNESNTLTIRAAPDAIAIAERIINEHDR